MSAVQPKAETPPARAVERIREIIVGRQLERIEDRLEAKGHMLQRKGEQIRIEEVRRAHATGLVVQQLEGRIGAWIGQWQQAVAEVVPPEVRSEMPVSSVCVCGGMRAVLARLVPRRWIGTVGCAGQVIGLQVFRRVSGDLVVSTGEIPLEAEEVIVRVMREAEGNVGEPLCLESGKQAHYVYEECHVWVAIIRGEADDGMVEDLAYLLRRIETLVEKCHDAGHVIGCRVRSLLQEGLLIRAVMSGDNQGQRVVLWKLLEMYIEPANPLGIRG